MAVIQCVAVQPTIAEQVGTPGSELKASVHTFTCEFSLCTCIVPVQHLRLKVARFEEEAGQEAGRKLQAAEQELQCERNKHEESTTKVSSRAAAFHSAHVLDVMLTSSPR